MGRSGPHESLGVRWSARWSSFGRQFLGFGRVDQCSSSQLQTIDGFDRVGQQFGCLAGHKGSADLVKQDAVLWYVRMRGYRNEMGINSLGEPHRETMRV